VENKDKLIFVGLWNPQKKYKKTRHNIGADSLFAFCEKYNINLKNHKSGKFQIGSYEIDDCELDVVVPMVSMNNSGEALREYLKNKNINYDNINSADYFRLRIGVGRPPTGTDPAEFVLSRFSSEEVEEVNFLVEDTIDIVRVFHKDRELAIKQASERRIIDVV
jgi:PTH1 family peptidyl-tRNA hydrolase